MKKARKYLKISWLVFLFIILVWSITGLQLFRDTKVRFGTSYANQSIAQSNSDALFSYFESLYGLGPRYFLNLETDKIYSESELPQGTTFFVNADIWDLFEFDILPAYCSGWILLLLFVLQYFFLLRKSPKTTIGFAQPAVLVEENANIQQNTLSRFDKTRFIIPSKLLEKIPLTITIISILIFVIDAYFVLINQSSTFWAFGKKNVETPTILILEFLLPSILYVIGCIINAKVIGRYIKEVENSAYTSLED